MRPEIITTRFANQPNCAICDRADDQHSFEEGFECAKEERARRLAIICPTCGKTVGQHTPGEVQAVPRNRESKGTRDQKGEVVEEPVEFDIPMEDFGDRPEDPEQLGKWRAEILNSICEVCGKIFGVHSEEEHRVCAEKSLQKLIPPQK